MHFQQLENDEGMANSRPAEGEKGQKAKRRKG
jgi:hypothetical protein